MFRKALFVFGLVMSFGANATVTTLNQTGTDPSGASLARTTIINLPSQSLAFNFVGALDTVGTVLNDQNAGSQFGLYFGNTLLKNISFFSVDTTNNIYSFNFKNLAAGDYSLRFNVNGNLASRAYSFTSTITTVTTPVPEPTSSALMLAGLLGMFAFTRKRNV